jgi:hypothetical protein
MKTLVYTVITANYDTLRPFKCEEGFDYVCFTDNLDIQANGWELVYIDTGLNPIKQQRLLKIQPPITETQTIYLDANFYITGKLSEFMNNHYKGGILTIKHPNRTLLSEEAKQIVKLKKDNPRNVNDHMAMLRLLTVPDNCGMYASGIIVRDNSLDRFSNKWAELLLRGSHRDQLSMGPAAWLTGTKIDTITWEEMQRYFKLTPHKRNASLL